MKVAAVFENHSLEYDRWYDKHPTIYHSELLALQRMIPDKKTGIEIGVGTGRFAQPLNIHFGVEPSENMAGIAESRGIRVFRESAENLSIKNDSFDFVLMVTALCFFADVPRALSEARRIIRPDGEIIVGFIDKDSSVGRQYEKEKLTNKFYKDAHFYTTLEITSLLKKAGFDNLQYVQTLTSNYTDAVEQPIPGFGKGSFIIIKANKN